MDKPLVVILIAGIISAAVLVAVAAMMLRRPRRRPDVTAATGPGAERSDRVSDVSAPMNGLESALSHVTDRSGRPIREGIDAEAGQVDKLRVANDAGPLLRRALDHVAGGGPDLPAPGASDDVADASGR